MDTKKQVVAAILEKITAPNYNVGCDPKHMQRFSSEFAGYVNNDDGGGLYLVFLYELAKATSPELVVELGNREGVSTSMLYAGLPQGSKLVTVDIKKNLSMLSPSMPEDPNVTFLWGDSTDPTLINGLKQKSIDILFVDTLHQAGHLRKELALYEPLLKDNALILLDDIDWRDMPEAWAEIPHEKESLSELHGSGFGIVYFVREEDSLAKS